MSVSPPVAVPADAALPRMRLLLDPDSMAQVLRRSLGRVAELDDVHARYLRYKPRTNLVVHYEVVVDGGQHDAVVRIAAGDHLERRVRKPRNVAMARAVDGRSPAANPLVYDAGLDAMIQWLPLDLSLPALAEPPIELFRRLREAGVDDVPGPAKEPRMVAYKPRRRAVLRVGRHVLKAYAQEANFCAAVAGLRSTSDATAVPAAGFEAALPDLRLTVQAALDGFAPVRAADVSVEAGALLRDLHRLPVRDPAPATPDHQLAAAAESANLVEAIAPGLRRRLQALVRRLEAAQSGAAPGAAVVAHGDFHAGQLLRGGELAVIDFDELCAAPPALDLATYAAHLVNGRDGELEAARTVLEDVAGGYGARPAGLDWYLATSILRRAPFPFRYLNEDWPDLVEGMVGAAEEATLA